MNIELNCKNNLESYDALYPIEDGKGITFNNVNNITARDGSQRRLEATNVQDAITEAGTAITENGKIFQQVFTSTNLPVDDISFFRGYYYGVSGKQIVRSLDGFNWGTFMDEAPNNTTPKAVLCVTVGGVDCIIMAGIKTGTGTNQYAQMVRVYNLSTKTLLASAQDGFYSYSWMGSNKASILYSGKYTLVTFSPDTRRTDGFTSMFSIPNPWPEFITPTINRIGASPNNPTYIDSFICMGTESDFFVGLGCSYSGGSWGSFFMVGDASSTFSQRGDWHALSGATTYLPKIIGYDKSSGYLYFCWGGTDYNIYRSDNLGIANSIEVWASGNGQVNFNANQDRLSFNNNGAYIGPYTLTAFKWSKNLDDFKTLTNLNPVNFYSSSGSLITAPDMTFIKTRQVNDKIYCRLGSGTYVSMTT